MKKKLTAVALVVCMLAIMLVGASLAYFTDDDKAENTMVIGDVKIDLVENVKSADGTKYEEFENDKFTLYPVANDEVYSDLNKYYNKVVRTFNVSDKSKNAVYIRTIVLFEKNDLLDDTYVGDGDNDIPGLHFAYVKDAGSGACVDGKLSRGSSTDLLDDTVTINGNEYWVVVFTDAEEKAIPYNDSLHTLNGVWMDKNITSEQIEGWYQSRNGKVVDDKVDIIVFSQGIQEEGLTHAEAMTALGEVNETNLQKWLNAEEATPAA